MGTSLTIYGEPVGNLWGICGFLSHKLPTFSLSNNSSPAPDDDDDKDVEDVSYKD